MATQTETGQNRIDALARAKPVPPGFLEDRRSVYWVDYVPPQPGSNGVTTIIATPRVQELARHRSPHREWKGDRPSPMWPVYEGTKQAEATPRIQQLSRSKTVYLTHYKMERSPYSYTSEAAKNAEPSQRIEALAIPKQRQDRYGTNETHWGQYIPVSSAALKATHSERIEQLSIPKGYNKLFQDERPVQWQVTDPALNAIATLRLQQLARPRSRTMIKDDYDPYKVSVQARRARATPRVEELCTPLPRKVRSKKIILGKKSAERVRSSKAKKSADKMVGKGGGDSVS